MGNEDEIASKPLSGLWMTSLSCISVFQGENSMLLGIWPRSMLWGEAPVGSEFHVVAGRANVGSAARTAQL